MQSPRPPSSPRPTRSVLLKIPNAKASKLNGRETWTFLALGEFVVYQVQQSSSNSGSRTPPPVPGRSVAAPALPARAGEGATAPAPIPVPQPVPWMNGSSSSPSPSSASSSTPTGAAGIVLAVRGTEFPISTTTTTTFEAPNTYILNNGDNYVVKIELDLPRTGSHEILDNVLRKYAHLGGSLGAPGATGGSASSSGASTPELRPSDFKGSLLLIDETTGKILGPLNQDMPMNENNDIQSTEAPNQYSSNDPVVVSFGDEDPNSANAGTVQVSAFASVTKDYGKSDSRIVGAAEYVSKGLLFAAEYGANYTSTAASNYKARTKATDTPLVFSPTTKKGVAMVAGGTEQAAKFTRGAVNFIGGKVEAIAVTAVNTGAGGLKKVGIGGGSASSNPNSGWRGALRSGIQAVTTVAEGFEAGGKHFLETGRQSTNTVVQHRYGDEARDITDSITSVGSNVVLVYVDARGVMHRALLKRAGKGALKARMKDGREVVLDDSGMEGQHTTRDEKGGLVIVDDVNGEAYDVEPAGGANYSQAGYSTGVESGSGSNSAALRRAPPAVPPRF